MTIPLRIDPHGYLNSNVDDLAIDPAALVAGINNDIGILLGERSLSPGIQLSIQPPRKMADGVRRDLLAHQLLGNPLHLAGGDSLQVGLCQSQNKGLLAALISFQDRRIELAIPGLGNLQNQRAYTRIQRPGLVAVALAAAIIASLIAAYTDMFVSLEFH